MRRTTGGNDFEDKDDRNEDNDNEDGVGDHNNDDGNDDGKDGNVFNYEGTRTRMIRVQKCHFGGR